MDFDMKITWFGFPARSRKKKKVEIRSIKNTYGEVKKIWGRNYLLLFEIFLLGRCYDRDGVVRAWY